MVNSYFVLLLLLSCNPNLNTINKADASFMESTAYKDSIQQKDNVENTDSLFKSLSHKKSQKTIKENVSIETKSQAADSFSLKDALLRKGIRFGTYLSVADITQRPPHPSNYLDLISEYFNFYTMSVSFIMVEPERGVFDFRTPDQIVEFAKAHGATVKGHALVNGNTAPDWLSKGNYTPEELKSILKTHVQTIVKHFKDKYPGVVTEWNVVNEAVCNDGQDKNSKICFPDAGIEINRWTNIHKPNSTDPTDYIQLAFQWAKEADPSAKLYLNENMLEINNYRKTERTYNLIAHLKQKGIPINGIGFQGHIRLYQKDRYSLAGFTAILNRFSSLGLETQVSEFDVLLASGADKSTSHTTPIPINNPSQADLQAQADIYKMFLQACLQSKNFKAFTVWGAWDKTSWTQTHWKGNFQPHILDSNLHLKPTYQTLVDAVKNK